MNKLHYSHQRITLFLFLVVVLYGIHSCKPANERACFKGSGDLDSLLVELPHFEKLILGEHMKFVLIQDTIEKVLLYGGENLLNQIFIDTDISNELSISNENRCRFFRYRNNEVVVQIHFIDLKEIIFNGSEELSNEGVLQFDDLKLTTLGACGSVNLHLNANEIYSLNEAGWPDITLRGFCGSFRAETFGNLILDLMQFYVNESIDFISQAGTLSKVNAQGNVLKVELSGTGDLWYYGVPSQIIKKEYNSGKLIDKN